MPGWLAREKRESMDRSMHRKPFGTRHLTRRQFSWLGAGAATALSIPLVGAPSRTFAAAAQASNLSGTVTQWCYPLASSGDQADDESLWKGLADEFSSANPNVQVSVEVLPWKDRNDKLTTALAAGAGPDVAYLNADLLPQHASDGSLVSLDDVVGGDTDFLENAKTNLTYDGTLYAAPILGTVTSAVFNTKVFEAAGVTEYPTTWDEMLAIGPQIRDAGYLLTSYAGALEQSLNLTYFPLLWQAGGEVVNEDGTAAAFNSAEGLDALNFVVTLFNEKFTDLDEGVTAPPADGGVVMDGKVAVLMAGEAGGVKRYEAGAWGAGSAKITAPLTRKVSTSYGTTAGFSVFKDAKNVDAAKAWVKFITEAPQMEEILKIGGFMPTRTSLGDMYADDPIVSAFQQYMPKMHGDIRNRSARQIISTVAPYIQAAFLGKQSPEDALAEAESDVNRLLARN